MTRSQIARRLLALLKPLIPLMTVSASSRVVNQGLGVLIPALAAALVVGSTDSSDVWALVAVLAALSVVKGTFRYVEQFTGHAVAFRLLSELRIDAYRNIVPLAPAGLEDERTGDLVARVIGDIDRVEPFYAHTIAPMASALLVPVLTATGLAIWVDPVTAAVFLPFPIVMVLVIPWIKARQIAKTSSRARELAGETAAIFTDSVQGAREVAIFKAREVVAGRIEEQSRMAATTKRALARVAASRTGLADLLAGLAVVAVAAVAAGRYQTGLLELGGLAAAVVVAWVGTAPARALEGIVPDLEQALAAAGRLFDLADRPPPVIERGADADSPKNGGVEFEDVTVRFSNASRPALDDVSLVVPDGSFVAVVGPSGSGKSTLVELLARFRDPDDGRVLLGGSDLRQLSPSTRRGRVAFVPQRPEIFFGTIEDNLRLARSNATDDELWGALGRAALADWVRSLQRGLGTTTGELGETMSGGQRQRLAIARAFLRESDVLVLDEATSELDVATERLVLDELRQERGEKTMLVVAHRLESVMDADEILVLQGGRLVERGTHTQLAAGGGVYSGLWRRHNDMLIEST